MCLSSKFVSGFWMSIERGMQQNVTDKNGVLKKSLCDPHKLSVSLELCQNTKLPNNDRKAARRTFPVGHPSSAHLVSNGTASLCPRLSAEEWRTGRQRLNFLLEQKAGWFFC